MRRFAVMSRSTRRSFPVTVSRLPMVRCQVCGTAVAHPRESAADALTEHYRRVHPELLGSPRA
jgi:hypothetical protein